MAMAEHEELPTFPNILPSSLRQSAFHEIEESDIQTDKDLRALIAIMYDHPERDFYYIRQRTSPSTGPLDRVLGGGTILEDEVELFWYRHPTEPHNYVRVEVRDGSYQWDWQKEAVEKSPMFVRGKLRLSERTRREMEIRQKIQAEKEAESNPIELKPGVAGISIDLIKAYHWIRKWLRRRRSRIDE